MSEVPQAREQWMRRAGPFFPLVVAAREHTQLPVAPELAPTDDDIARSLAWLPVVGIVVGGLLAFAAAILFAFKLHPALVAIVVLGLTVVARGVPAEIACGRAIVGLVRGSAGEETARLLITVIPLLMILLRAGALLSVSTSNWSAALVASMVAGAWTTAMIKLGPALLTVLEPRRADEEPIHRDVRWTAAVSSAVAIATVLACGVAVGGVIVLAALGSAMVVVWRRRGSAVVVGGWVELAALLCFALWAPAG